MTSSIYPVDFVVSTADPIVGGNNILSTPITITSDQVSPGGGGVLRLYFSFTMGGSSMISVRIGASGNTLKGNLNADNSSLLEIDGYYRFDIDIEAGDIINLRSSSNITNVNLFRAHLIQFGA